MSGDDDFDRRREERRRRLEALTTGSTPAPVEPAPVEPTSGGPLNVTESSEEQRRREREQERLRRLNAIDSKTSSSNLGLTKPAPGFASAATATGGNTSNLLNKLAALETKGLSTTTTSATLPGQRSFEALSPTSSSNPPRGSMDYQRLRHQESRERLAKIEQRNQMVADDTTEPSTDDGSVQQQPAAAPFVPPTLARSQSGTGSGRALTFEQKEREKRMHAKQREERLKALAQSAS